MTKNSDKIVSRDTWYRDTWKNLDMIFPIAEGDQTHHPAQSIHPPPNLFKCLVLKCCCMHLSFLFNFFIFLNVYSIYRVLMYSFSYFFLFVSRFG